MRTETVPETLDIGTTAARPDDTLGYARVSTADQNLDAQRNRLLEAGAIRLFTDVASGRRSERPGLAALIDHARPGDRLCITRLDRLGRTLKELLETVDGLKARGIHLVSLEERLDTSSAADELVFHVFGSIAHFEARLISERIRDGIAEARKRGRQPGRPPLDPETVSAAQKLIEAGLSPARAARQLGIARATADRLAAASPHPARLLETTGNRPSAETEAAYHRQKEHTAFAVCLKQKVSGKPGAVKTPDCFHNVPSQRRPTW